MLATSTGTTVRFIRRDDRGKPADQQTTFILKSLCARARMLVLDHMVSIDEDSGVQMANPGTGMLAACQYGISDWENLLDEQGRQVHCKRRRRGPDEVLADESLNRIADGIMELGAEIVQMNRIGDEEDQESEEVKTTSGKSGSSSTSEPTGPSSATTAPSLPGSTPAPPAAAAPQNPAPRLAGAAAGAS